MFRTRIKDQKKPDIVMNVAPSEYNSVSKAELGQLENKNQPLTLRQLCRNQLRVAHGMRIGKGFFKEGKMMMFMKISPKNWDYQPLMGICYNYSKRNHKTQECSDKTTRKSNGKCSQ